MSRAFSNIKRTLLAAAGVVAGMALGAEGQLSMGMAEAWTWVEVPGVAWSAWETRVESAAEGLAESARWVPPMPRGAVAYLGQGVEEWPTALTACMEVVAPSVTVGGVPAWEVRVTEWVGEDGARQWVTHCGGVALHAQTVPAGFDPEAWSLAVYTEDGTLPDFIAGDATLRTEWFENRGRERLGFSYTFVAAGQVEAFQAALDAEEAARLEELEKAAQEGEELPWVFAVREMKPTAGTMAFALCNPDGADVDVLGKPELTEPWEYVGRVETERRRWATFGLPMGPDGKAPLYFWKFLDATRDSDGDGIPDGMEVAYFETNPMKADTAGSMIDDWRKIYLYGMDATIADADGDGLPDGWEVLNGLDPYSGEGANGATGDLDGDGVSNALELAYGTNPGAADSDGDGLQDRTEMGWATVFAKRGPAVLGGERRAVADGGEMAFPFAVQLGGRRYDRVRVSRAGLLTLEGAAPLTIRLWEGPVTWEEAWLAGIFAEVGTWQEKPAMALSFENFGLQGEDSGTLGRVQVLFVKGEAANVLWCHGDATIVERFYNGGDTTSAQCFGEDGDKVAWEADMAWLYKTPLTCPEGVLKQLQEGEAYCFIETCTIGPLSISLSLMDESIEETDEDGIRIAACGLESLQPEARYSVIDLRSNTLTSRVSEEDVNVFFVHGYNVSESGSMAWCNTIFKRLWQSGMNVRFYGVTWNGDEQSGLPDYYTNVVNAFNAAEAFANVMRNVPGKKIVMAHSLGNMVVSSAIQDHEAPVDVYFMLNSAVPAEAYDTEAPTYDFSIDGVPEGLIHDAWDAYPPKSYAALWHRHFLPHEGFLPMAADEARAQLTWKGRFKDVLDNRGVEVYNFYSAGDGTQSGDEVFELAEMTPRPTSGFGWVWWNPIRPLVDIVSDNVILGRHSWQKQECWKGRYNVLEFSFMASETMGWGFEEPQKTNEDTEKMSDEDFRKSPIFCRNPQTVFGDDAQPILEQRDLLLSSAIPAMSEATGRSFLSGIDDSRQIDCQDIYVDSRHSVQWVNRVERLGKQWLHSDVKTLAYPFVKGLFDEIVKQGGLK